MRRFPLPSASLALFTALAAAGLSAARAAQDDKVVPVHEEPRHHLVFDSPQTRILDVQIPPGDTTLFHTHSDPILYVTMSTSQTRSQTHGREWPGGDASTPASPAPASPGEATPAPAPPRPVTPPANPPAPARLGRMMSTTSYAQQPVTHRVNNVGSTLFRLIGITNSTAGDDSTGASPDFAAKPEITNRWFRGYRWALTPATATEHRHANPVAIVLLTGRVNAGNTTLDRPGTFAWFNTDVPHVVRAIGADAEAVEVEVRRPR